MRFASRNNSGMIIHLMLIPAVQAQIAYRRENFSSCVLFEQSIQVEVLKPECVVAKENNVIVQPPILPLGGGGDLQP